MQQRKLKVAFGFAPYGGNGAAASEHPDIRNWLIPTILKAKSDPRIDDDILYRDINDTPVTLVRNELVHWARQSGADVLVTVDSDNTPDIEAGMNPLAKPFFESSFNFLYDHYERGPVCIGAPYCGPPKQADGSGSENVYVFLWRNFNSTNPEEAMQLDQFQREEAALRTGIEPVAALPTGCIMYDLRVFDLIPPPYFFYEYKEMGPICNHCGERKRGPEREKDSTEDVAATRNISMCGQQQLGYNPVFCNWDAWAGHWKPRCVGKPIIIGSDAIGDAFRQAVLKNVRTDRRVMHVHRNPRLPVHPSQRAGIPRIEVDYQSNGKHDDGVLVHPDDPILADQFDTSVSDPFRAAHTTSQFDLDMLAAIVKRHLASAMHSPLRIVEIGSWIGDSANAMADAIEELNDAADYEIHCIDHFKGANPIQNKCSEELDVYGAFCRNVGSRLSKQIVPHRNCSSDAAVAWGQRDEDKRWIDVLFIDGGHDYEDVNGDIVLWTPFVRDGGLVIGHDYSSQQPGVKQAVHENFGYGVGVDGIFWHLTLERQKTHAG